MYSTERTKWWVERTLSKGHQTAYNSIASRIVPQKDSVIVDHCCGNAELLKKIICAYRMRNSSVLLSEGPLFIGTEGNDKMLATAQENVRAVGIESTIIESGDDVLDRRGLVFVREDLSNSTLPPNISDVTLLTFPELHINLQTETVKTILDMSNIQSIPDLGNHLASYLLSRVTKRGKSAIICDYDCSRGRGSSIESLSTKLESERGALYGLKLVGNIFSANPEVARDIDEARRSSFGDLGMLGYRTLFFTKT